MVLMQVAVNAHCLGNKIVISQLIGNYGDVKVVALVCVQVVGECSLP